MQISFKEPSNARGLDKIRSQCVLGSGVNYVSSDTRDDIFHGAKTEMQKVVKGTHLFQFHVLWLEDCVKSNHRLVQLS